MTWTFNDPDPQNPLDGVPSLIALTCLAHARRGMSREDVEKLAISLEQEIKPGNIPHGCSATVMNRVDNAMDTLNISYPSTSSQTANIGNNPVSHMIKKSAESMEVINNVEGRFKKADGSRGFRAHLKRNLDVLFGYTKQPRSKKSRDDIEGWSRSYSVSLGVSKRHSSKNNDNNNDNFGGRGPSSGPNP